MDAVQTAPSWCLRLRTADPLAMVRSDCAHQEVFDDYFKLLETTLDSLQLSGTPQCIYNMDETGMPLDAKQPKRIALKGMKKFMDDLQEIRCRLLWSRVQVRLVM